MALFTIGVSWSIFFLSDYIRGFSIIYFFSILYSWILKPNIPIFATPLWSWAIAILFLQPFSADLSAYLGVAIIVYAYELLLDYRDRKADKEFCKTPTLSNILGKSTQIIAGTLFLSGIALLA
ncbi:hypothetical protein A3D66_00075 [Candidatus Kaiserbacteria bacterium RIFCSPHIGHO2_02_FULL_50_9]|nr:MAG: hypothetical protein A3D66_00075 [Candidatus Kaiserbacteria bacterium RIFCSPHIGHO2_02_FULL_50_9]